jgi:hypothetical protein
MLLFKFYLHQLAFDEIHCTAVLNLNRIILDKTVLLYAHCQT